MTDWADLTDDEQLEHATKVIHTNAAMAGRFVLSLTSTDPYVRSVGREGLLLLADLPGSIVKVFELYQRLQAQLDTGEVFFTPYPGEEAERSLWPR